MATSSSSSPSSPSSPSFPSPPAYSAHSSSSPLWKIKNAKYRSTLKEGQPSIKDLQNHLEYIRDPHFTSAVSG
ncbi:hypothetical protein BU25DRAFT_406289 [Macroventuria anomochaeta]|uniref:Uncharacterized protein n=1 Tax=Macroventuria anomochaeta TaxID=301207 RepID=A0ACB6SFC6_9PLEO|nr:uncharacterized protein BU25DRAFT_406289 [Macroventuria anomochaeta]KAF2633021.1 hypothetical protein BU25DRAFT_406289 [Macroventuria anomochaeta]